MIESSLPQSEPVMLPGRPFGRVARNVVGYGLLTALMIVTPMLVFVPAALLHCALRNGRRAAWAALALSAVLASLYVAGVPGNQPDVVKMAWTYLVAVILAVAVPAMASLAMVERGEAFGRVLVFLLIGSAIGLAVTESGSRAIAAYSPYAAQVDKAREQSLELVDFYRRNGMPPEMIRFAEKWIDYSTFVLPAVLLVNLSLVFILSLLMLGRLQVWHERTARTGPAVIRPEPVVAQAEAVIAEPEAVAQPAVAPPAISRPYLFRNLALPDWLLFAFVLGGLTPLATGMLQKVAANSLALVTFLYIVQGLAIFRFLLAAMNPGVIGAMLGWLLLVFLMFTGVGPLLLGLAGLFDSFFDFRHFKKRKDDSHEGHTD